MKALKTKFKTTLALALALIMIPATAFAAEEGFETGNSQKNVQVTVNGPQIQYKVTLPLSVTMKDVNDLTEDEINAINSGAYTDLKTNKPFAYVGFIPVSVEGNIGTKKLKLSLSFFDLDYYRNTDTNNTLFNDYKSINGGATDLTFAIYQRDLQIASSEVAAGFSNSYAYMFYLTAPTDGRVMPAGSYSGNQSIDITLVD